MCNGRRLSIPVKHSKGVVRALKEAHERIDALAALEIDNKTKKDCLEQVTFLTNYILGKTVLDRQKSDEVVSFKLPKGIM